MPPAKKFQREDIIRTAYELVKSEGMGEMNARRIAKELGCSTQPIYHNFDLSLIHISEPTRPY